MSSEKRSCSLTGWGLEFLGTPRQHGLLRTIHRSLTRARDTVVGVGDHVDDMGQLAGLRPRLACATHEVTAVSHDLKSSVSLTVDQPSA